MVIMQKQWFVLHALTGQEAKVRASILRRVKQEEMEENVGDVLIPTEKVSEVKKGVRSTATRKFFPGYVLINMALYDEERQMCEKAWYFIRQTPGMIGFVGGEKPAPLRDKEVEYLETAIRQAGGNRVKAAELLGISRATLYRKLPEEGVTPPEEASAETAG